VARYKGMTVAQMSDLRRKMGDAGAKFKVIKNRLAKIALDNAADGAAADLFLEPTGIAFAKDPTAAAKAASAYAKTNDKFVIVGGLLAALFISIYLLPTMYVWVARDTDHLPAPDSEWEEAT